MVASDTGKRRGWRVALGALVLGTAIAGFGAAPALAHDDDDEDEGWHGGWEHRDRDEDRDRDAWRRHEWQEREEREHQGWAGYGYYAPPPVVYVPPRAYSYYPEPSLNVYIPLR